MNLLSLKQIELSNLIPQFNIQELEKLISFARENNSDYHKNAKKSLAGIWSDVKFDGIDLENVIRQLRAGLVEHLNNKKI